MKVNLFRKIISKKKYSISGGFFKARLDFPKEYPIKPPKMV
jgi:ubiquitin-protein ligase